MDKHDGLETSAVRIDDPRPGEQSPAATAEGTPQEGTQGGIPAQEGPTDPRGTGDVYLDVQASPAFREVRSRYFHFVIPAVAIFLVWYFAYVVAATTAPELMRRQVVGSVNVAMLAGLGQFVTTFLLTWAYARHARLRRDRDALELRWDTQEMTRGVER
ncbi:DUF485 domain-containing protein [Streptomyces sp. NPDC058045]|uniref:DUF485 domain-containing protein n=1 Tax=Streptomyces sp. NPDC058045 TaxID=3346311 RepID=UPI0036E281E9